MGLYVYVEYHFWLYCNWYKYLLIIFVIVINPDITKAQKVRITNESHAKLIYNNTVDLVNDFLYCQHQLWCNPIIIYDCDDDVISGKVYFIYIIII